MATLLLLDADARFRTLAAALLERRGHAVLQAGRCAEARRLLQARPVDLLVVDALLPDGAGPDFIRARRASHGGGELILLLSAFWKKDLATVAKDAGAQGFLARPVTPEELLRRIDRMTGTRTEPALSPESEAELAGLRTRFAGELPALVDGVRAAVVQLRARPQAPGLFGVARRRAHQLAGVAGSFGYQAVGDSCAAIEEALLALQTGAGDAWARIDAALRELLPDAGGSSVSAA